MQQIENNNFISSEFRRVFDYLNKNQSGVKTVESTPIKDQSKNSLIKDPVVNQTKPWFDLKKIDNDKLNNFVRGYLKNVLYEELNFSKTFYTPEEITQCLGKLFHQKYKSKPSFDDQVYKIYFQKIKLENYIHILLQILNFEKNNFIIEHPEYQIKALIRAEYEDCIYDFCFSNQLDQIKNSTNIKCGMSNKKEYRIIIVDDLFDLKIFTGGFDADSYDQFLDRFNNFISSDRFDYIADNCISCLYKMACKTNIGQKSDKQSPEEITKVLIEVLNQNQNEVQKRPHIKNKFLL